MKAALYQEALFAAAGLAYGLLLLLLLLSRRTSITRTLLAVACAATAGTCGAIALGWTTAGSNGGLTELATTGAWTGFTLHLLQRQLSAKRALFRLLVVGAVSIVVALAVSSLWPHNTAIQSSSLEDLTARLALGVYGLMLTENLYRNTAAEARWHLNLLCIALGGIFAYSTLLYADALLFHRISAVLWAGKAIVLIVAAPLLTTAAVRNRDWAIDIHVSRAIAFHTATLIGGGIFLLALAITGEVLRTVGPGWGDVAEVTLLIAGVTGLGIVLSSGTARSRLRRFLADNFYSHRFDYRREWLKSIDTLSATNVSVQTRAISAVAEVADSPAGVLWVRDLDGSVYRWAGSWNQPAAVSVEPVDSPFIDLFRGGTWIVELDDISIRPACLEGVARPWIAVPLLRQNELIGFIVFARPRAAPKLNRETFDLIRIIARQAAAQITEHRYAQTLSEMRQLHEFSSRFAFVIHDIKNVVGQLGMIVHNAQHHEHDAAFHKDVLATVRASVDRMNRALTRLRARESWSSDGVIVPLDLINEEVAALERSHGVAVDVRHDGRIGAVAMDSDDFRSVIAHLCSNAVEAAGAQMRLRLRHDAFRVEIEISDQGSGMPAEFIRDDLFQPFRSSKGDGFGIGAYQARELVRAAGGDILVSSCPGMGTTMKIVLPCAGQGRNRISPRSGAEVIG